jgi:RNA polymerase sigma-70 factor, ECF subfamily
MISVTIDLLFTHGVVSPVSMPELSKTDRVLIDRIRRGDADAWSEFIARYEGRLLAFVESRVGRRHVAEDLVQETLIGFLKSLPNYDGKRSLEAYLFSICAYKLTDHLRREGRRPALPLWSKQDSEGQWQVPARGRAASSIARSGERRGLEEKSLAEALRAQVDQLQRAGDWTRLMCIELLFVNGWANKDVAAELSLTEQQVANFKFEFLARLRKHIRKQGLSEDVFPELYPHQPP